MRKKRIFWVILCLFILVFGYKYYDNNCSNEGILEKVKNRNGYILNQIQEPVIIKLFIKPEWIPFNSDKKIDLNEKLLELHSTNIILDHVENTGNEIYFSFRATYSMDYNNGAFIYNGILNEDGTFTSSTAYKELMLYNKNQTKIEEGQSGGGSRSFSFGIVPENYKYIKEGFYVEYSGFILYEYIKKWSP